jgi:hypothetical protein
MALTAKQRSRKLREEFERRGREFDMAVPLQRRIAEHICAEANGGHGMCVCAKTPAKPVCQTMEGLARWVIDTVRAHDRNPT